MRIHLPCVQFNNTKVVLREITTSTWPEMYEGIWDGATQFLQDPFSVLKSREMKITK